MKAFLISHRELISIVKYIKQDQIPRRGYIPYGKNIIDKFILLT